jgi:Zn-finger nucleic acid-binding protein
VKKFAACQSRRPTSARSGRAEQRRRGLLAPYRRAVDAGRLGLEISSTTVSSNIEEFQEQEMDCPRDGAPLTTEPYGVNRTVDRCRACAGVWLDLGELETIQQDKWRAKRRCLESDARGAHYRSKQSSTHTVHESLLIDARSAGHLVGCRRIGGVGEIL